jgi:hypothetical protein
VPKRQPSRCRVSQLRDQRSAPACGAVTVTVSCALVWNQSRPRKRHCRVA